MMLGGNDQGDMVTAMNVDLSNCDREVIHLPDMIQPHGVLLVLRPGDLVILRASENTAELLGVAAADLVMGSLSDAVGDEQAAHLRRAIAGAGDGLRSGPLQLVGRVAPNPRHGAFDAIAHRSGDTLILELETVSLDHPERVSLYPELTACITRLRSAAGVQDFLDLAVEQVRAFTGFDRVMAYRFEEDGSGEVVSEAGPADGDTYRGMYFPAMDIPAPARRLFTLSWLRHLPDANYTPVRMVPATGEPIDMSIALLRHVSVMYSGYLKNMGVHATMVMPVMKAGRLWGLISCMHHAGPLHVPCDIRTANEVMGNMVSLLLAEHDEQDTAAYRQRMADAIAGLDRQMAREKDHYRGLCNGAYSLHGWLDAAGVALVTDDDIVLFGATPTREELSGIVSWLAVNVGSAMVFSTDRLAALYPAAKRLQATASGILVTRLMQSRIGFVIWFRPEVLQSVEWAGNPHKPVFRDMPGGETHLSPRTSFEAWKETVRGRGAPWLDCEIKAAGALRQVIAEAALLRLNEALKRSNSELDSFAFVASHDLKEPLRGISNFATFLKRSAGPKLTEEEQGRIETIIRLTRRMDDLTDSLLEYSRIGRTEFRLEAVDLNALLRRILESLEPRLAEKQVEVRIPRPLPAIRTDRVWLGEVFSNLITNAIKYNDRPVGERWVEITWQTKDGHFVFAVRDNGIGIAPQHLTEVFQIFRRLHARDEYGGGSGAGLTIARRTLERLGGRLWAESEGLGKGSTVLFSLGYATTSVAPP